ncbi:MAG: hypothetical protein KGV44_07570 [Flavobacteriaceae bacterium]|nr:hypothetical protein [Flavobacteriaceae bacterium]
MKESNTEDLIKIRRFICKNGVENISIEEAEKAGINIPELLSKYGTLSNIVEQLLAHEREVFENIFVENDFTDVNAIDILLLVSQEIREKFHYLSPAVTLGLKKLFPQIYAKHIESRLAFIYDKIKINIEKGIEQKMYRQDISVEMMARLYVSKLNEIHNPEIFPASELTFSTVFSRLVKDFIYTNANEEGIAYYKHRRQLYNILNFGH